MYKVCSCSSIQKLSIGTKTFIVCVIVCPYIKLSSGVKYLPKFKLAETVAVPGDTPLIVPFWSMVATEVLSIDHVIVVSSVVSSGPISGFSV